MADISISVEDLKVRLDPLYVYLSGCLQLEEFAKVLKEQKFLLQSWGASYDKLHLLATLDNAETNLWREWKGAKRHLFASFENEDTVAWYDFKQNWKNFQKDIHRIKEFSSEIPILFLSKS